MEGLICKSLARLSIDVLNLISSKMKENIKGLRCTNCYSEKHWQLVFDLSSGGAGKCWLACTCGSQTDIDDEGLAVGRWRG